MNVHIHMPKSTNQKQQILKAALALFSTKGYSSTPVSLLARTAGVSQGLLYNFFASKEEVLKEIATEGFGKIRLTMASYRNESDPKNAIARHLQNVQHELKTNAPFWRMVHIIRLQEDVLDIIRPFSNELVGEVLTHLKKAFTKLRHPQPELEALALFSQIDGLVSLYLFNPDIPLPAICRLILKRYAI